MILGQLIVQVMLPIALLVMAGALWSRLPGGLAAPVLRVELNRLILYVFSPALVFSIAARTDVTLHLLSVPLVTALASLMAAALLYVLLFHSSLGRNLAPATRGSLIIAGMFGNLFFVGLPILTFLYGPVGGSYVTYTDVIAGTTLIWSVGVAIASRIVPAPAPVSLWRVMSRLPPIWAFLIGGLVHQLGVPVTALIDAAHLIGQATVPVTMFVLGLSIPWRALRPSRAILGVVAVKLVLMPFLAWMLAQLLFGAVTEAHQAAIVEAAMPSMLLGILFSDRFGLDVEATALAIGWSTVLFWFTLPAWLVILGPAVKTE
jgi:predicted permease